MNKKSIDTICWWIPIRKTRDAVRDYLYTIDNIEHNEKILIIQNIRIETRLKLSSMTKQIIRETRSPKLIISITSFPERIFDVDVVIYSLINQSIKADKIILWLSNEEFPNKLDDVPEHITALQKLGLEIGFCKNIGSYKKLIPTLIKYPDDIIVMADDDIYYPFKWLEQLYNAYLENPNYLHSHIPSRISFDNNGRRHKYAERNKIFNRPIQPSYLNLILSGGGAICTRKLLYEDTLDEDKFTKLCPTADDLWFWAMAVLNGTKINLIDSGIIDIVELIDLGIDRDWKKLWETNVSKNHNDIQIEALLNYYTQLANIIGDR